METTIIITSKKSYKEFLKEVNALMYLDLIGAVAKISIPAALYMRNEARELPSFVADVDLADCFIWEDTPFGYAFWCCIHLQLTNGES